MIKPRVFIWLALVLALFAPASLNSGVWAQTPAPTDQQKLRRETFELVWQTVDRNFYDPNFNGVDWKAVHDRYSAQLDKVTTDAQLYSLLQLMVNELHQSHFWIVPPERIPKLRSKPRKDETGTEAGEEEESPEESEPETPLDLIKEDLADQLSTGIGIDVRVLAGQAVITRVERGSAAARAGLRPGFVIKSVDGRVMTEAVAELENNPVLRDIIRPEIPLVLVANYINGDIDRPALLTYLDARGVQRRVRISRERLSGEMSAPVGNLPSMYTEFEAKRLAGGIGYIRFNAFVPNLMKKVCAALREMHDAPGLILDLRGNQGGLLGMISGLGGLVQHYSSLFGNMKMRSGQTPVFVFPQRAPYTGALAILIDGSTQSAAEIFVAGLQNTKRAVVVGETSAGSTLPAVIIKLPTGALFQYAFGNYQTPQGINLEGRGVIPDHAVALTRRALLRGSDPQLATAIARLRQQIAPPKVKELIADVTVLDDPVKKKSEGPAVVTVAEPPPPPPKPVPTPKAGGDPNSAVEENVRIARQVLTRYVAEVGGESALAKIQNSVATGTVELPLGLIGSVEIYEAAPNRSSVIMNLKGLGVVQQTNDRGISWLQDPLQGYVRLGEVPPGLDTFHRELEMLRRASSFRFERKQKVGDRDCIVLTRRSGDVVIGRYYFDVLTGLLVREGDLYLEDYREVGGLKIAFVARSEGARGTTTVVRLKDVKFNVTIDESKFAERADCFSKPEQKWRD
ncbi:MAG TPA: S41 family peptidase [Pyrinomonadaceae bacterium]|nr:S41 family peptidase [Pyrinomonadaceae bacterium]